MSTQQAFSDALLATDPVCPPGLTTWNGSAPEKRFAIYRNNVVVGLIDALADNFPVTQELVGEQFFRAMARQFVRAAPPRSPVLAQYGEGFAEFIAAFPAAAGLPYLADVAKLELLRVHAWYAADAEPLSAERIGRLLADVDALPEARFALHPSVRILRSRHAIVSLWTAHQSESAALALATVNPDQPEIALVRREGLAVEISAISVGTAEFIESLRQGRSFGRAAEQALGADIQFDLAATLGSMMRSGLLVSVTISRSATP